MYKYAYMYRRKNLMITILLIIQLVFLILNLYSSSMLNVKLFSEKEQIKYFFEEKSIYGIENRSHMSKTDVNLNSATIIEKYIDNNKDKNFKLTVTATGSISLNKFKGYEQFKIENSPEFDNDFFTNNLTVNNEATKEFPFKVIEGRSFTGEELIRNHELSEKIPVILGYDFKDYFKIGDLITLDGGDQAIVIGILDKNQLNPGNLQMSNRFINLDKFIVTPNTYRDKGEYLTGSALLIFDEDIDKDYINNIANDIRNIFGEVDHKVDVRDFTDEVYSMADIYLAELKDKLMMTIILTIFIFISFSIAISNSILIRKKEFGVHYLVGATDKNIILWIIYELGIINVVSFIISLLVLMNKSTSINLKAILTTLLVIIALNILILIIPIKSIIKIKLSQLIKGDD